jgi:hypothetical protein
MLLAENVYVILYDTARSKERSFSISIGGKAFHAFHAVITISW